MILIIIYIICVGLNYLFLRDKFKYSNPMLEIIAGPLYTLPCLAMLMVNLINKILNK